MPNPPRPPGEGWSRERRESCPACGNNRVYKRRPFPMPDRSLQLTCARCRRVWWRPDA